MQEINLLGGYFYTELVAADASSRKIGAFINKQIPSNYGGRNQVGRASQPGTAGNDGKQPGTVPKNTINTEAGSINTLYGDWDFKFYDPTHPSTAFEPFVKSQKRNVANGLDVAYNTFGNDLENVNFSSMRGGVLDERDAWMDSQEQVIDHIEEPEFAEWLKIQLLRPDSIYHPDAFDRLNAPVFLGRRWQWVDPLKDGQANVLQIAMGATTPQDVAANLGNDFDENIEAITEALTKLEPVRKTILSLLSINQLFDVTPPKTNNSNQVQEEGKKNEDQDK